MNPHVIELMLQEKRQQMLEEAERQRLLSQAKRKIAQERKIRRAKRMLTFGDFLIRTGYRLKKKYKQTLIFPDSCKAQLR